MSLIGRVLTRRGGAAFAGTALLMGGVGLTALAPAASAGVTTPTVHCVLPAGQGEGTGPQTMDVTLSPANAAPGTMVHAVVNLGPGPVNSTQTLNDLATIPSIDLAMSGGATGTVTLTGPTFSIDTVTGQPVQIPQWETDLLIPNTAQGVVNFTPVRTLTRTNAPIVGWVNTPCDVVSGATSIGSVNVQGPGSEQPSLLSPSGVVYRGQPLTFEGLGWPAGGGTPTLSLCPAAGGACVATPFTAAAPTVSASGVLSGTATLAKSGLTDGAYTLTVTLGAKQATSTLTVQTKVPSGPRTMTLSQSSGPVGSTVTVTGSNWAPNAAITVGTLTAADLTVKQVLVPSTWDGKFTANLPITSDLVVKIRAREAANVANEVVLPYTVVTAPPTVTVATPGEIHRGATVALTGANWAGTVSASLCDAAGANCVSSDIAATTLTVAPDGALSGNVQISSTAPVNVNRTIKVTSSNGVSVSSGVVYLNERWIALPDQTGPIVPGTLVKIRTHDFSKNLWVSVAGFDAQGNRTTALSGNWSDTHGDANSWLLIDNPNTVTIKAWVTIYPDRGAYLPITMAP